MMTSLDRATLDRIDRIADQIAGLAQLLEDAAAAQSERMNPTGTRIASQLISEMTWQIGLFVNGDTDQQS